LAGNEHRTRRSALTRRTLVAAALAGVVAPVRAQGWFDLRDDKGEVVENMRVAVELVAAVDQLPGRMMLGPDVPFVRMIEFFDYNCPICRRAARDLELLVGTDGDLGVMLVHNPILAPSSRTAAAYAIAIATRRGPDLALRFHADMFSRPGAVSPLKLRSVVEAIGLDPDAVERDAGAMAPAVKDHADLAASLGFAVTPSFILGSVSLLGYPGPASMRRFTESAAKCGDVQCS
jgi:protein-disulfide isomerase